MPRKTSWRDIEPYSRWAEPLAKELERLIQERRPGADEEAVRETAGWLALICVLSAKYGAGDALAGYILGRIGRKIRVEQVMKILEKMGIEGIPEHRIALWAFCSDVMRSVDWRDEKVNRMMRELYDYAVSGGRWSPKWHHGG